MNKMYKAMTIAGSDTSGGAGMEADLKTMEELGVYGMVALTCIVAQNPANNWSHDISGIELPVIEKQLHTILDGIGVDAMKTGMLGSGALVELVAHTIDKYHLKNVVIDPVMVCKGVDAIMVPEAAKAIKELLVQKSDVITPNLLEAAYLSGMDKVSTLEEMKEAAARLHDQGAKYIIIKAGERLSGNDAVDLLYDGKEYLVKKSPKIPGAFNNGAGCTFSAGITAGLAKGLSIQEAFAETKIFITAALKNSFRINQWAGALMHCAHRK
jgi:pyridoxine kinase